MVDNRHMYFVKKITGYRDLTEEEIALMNKVKTLGVIVENLLEEIGEVSGIDHRWLALATTDLQKGFMFATRAIARPTTF